MHYDTVPATAAEAVARGAALLDEYCPGWVDKIDLDRLDTWSTSDCLLGQLYPSYNAGIDDLMDQRCGFDTPGAEPPFTHAELTAEWKTLIENRRFAAV